VCDDLPKNISKIFPQQTFQTCITGGKVAIAVKGGKGFTIDWNVPFIWAGNWHCNYVDKGQISRRMLIVEFKKNVINPDPSLKSRIVSSELPAFIYKCLLYYKKLLSINCKKDIWALCPEYFLEQQQEFKIERNALYKFLIENTRYKKDNVVLLEEIRNNFNNWLGPNVKNVSNLDNGTFFQVNKEYTIEKIMTCKFCFGVHKKGCCDQYNRTQKSTKKIVKNIEFMNVLLDVFPE
jgi:phage/plasmid-associated DNA primase